MAAQFDSLIDFLKQIPAVEPAIGSGQYEDGNWWMKFTITPLPWLEGRLPKKDYWGKDWDSEDQ